MYLHGYFHKIIPFLLRLLGHVTLRKINSSLYEAKMVSSPPPAPKHTQVCAYIYIKIKGKTQRPHTLIAISEESILIISLKCIEEESEFTEF